ncbi:MAG: hypothetical protein Q9218_000727 [Villophora microphyllina]
MNVKPNLSHLRPPFAKEHQLNNAFDASSQGHAYGTLLSRRWVPSAPGQSLTEVLLADIRPTRLNRLAAYLWMCSTPSHTNVPPLHSHAVHGRNVVVSEDPALHLVWTTGIIYIKPLPAYLLSHAFWIQYLAGADMDQDRVQVRQAAMGLLRSYYYCVRHESDLRVAQQPQLSLIPTNITWAQWCNFSTSFDTIKNSEVAPRYHYGKLQLSRLHWLVRIRLRELNYFYIDGYYGESFARYYGPLLFIFGTLSVLLSAMQVGMAVEQLQTRNWVAFWSVCRWFSVISLLLSAVVALYLIVSLLIKTLDEIIWAARAQYGASHKPKTDVT